MGPFSSASTSYPSCLTSGIGAFIPSKIVERVTSQLRMWTLSPRVPGVCPRGSRTSYTRVVNLVWDAQSLPLSLQTASRQAYGAGNAVDFIHYPEGKTSSDVVDVLPHEGRTAEPVSSRILLVPIRCLRRASFPGVNVAISPAALCTLRTSSGPTLLELRRILTRI